ncbi:MAG: hypothetical protein ACRC92_27310 [Peptostreptococcaceae bacterium]
MELLTKLAKLTPFLGGVILGKIVFNLLIIHSRKKKACKNASSVLCAGITAYSLGVDGEHYEDVGIFTIDASKIDTRIYNKIVADVERYKNQEYKYNSVYNIFNMYQCTKIIDTKRDVTLEVYLVDIIAEDNSIVLEFATNLKK